MALSRTSLLLSFVVMCIINIVFSDSNKGDTAKDGYDYYHEWAAKNLPKDGEQVPGDIRGKLDDLVEGVKKAMQEEHAAKDRKEVLDLGQSLHLLESKFSKLRDTIFKQFLSNKNDEGKDDNHKTGKTSKDLEEIEKTTSEMVHKFIDQQTNVNQIQTDVDRLEKTIQVLTNNLNQLESDIVKTAKMLKKLDHSHEELRSKADKHYETLINHGDHIEDLAFAKSAGHSKFYYLIVFEMVALAMFAFIRRRNARKNKYNKMG